MATKKKVKKQPKLKSFSHEEIMEKLGDKVQTYTGFGNPRVRAIEGNAQIVCDLVYLLYKNGKLSKSELEQLFNPYMGD